MRGTQRCTAIDAIVFDTNDGLKLADKKFISSVKKHHNEPMIGYLHMHSAIK